MYLNLTQGFTLGYGLKVSPSGLRVERLVSANFCAFCFLRASALNASCQRTLCAFCFTKAAQEWGAELAFSGRPIWR